MAAPDGGPAIIGGKALVNEVYMGVVADTSVLGGMVIGGIFGVPRGAAAAGVGDGIGVASAADAAFAT